MVERTFSVAGEARRRGTVASIELWCAPDATHPELVEWARRHGATLHVQQGDDLGARMRYALAEALARGDVPILVGTDCPAIDAAYLASASAALEAGDAVLGPVEDGGYALVAGNGDSIFRRLMALIGRDDLGADPSLADNAGRAARAAELDEAIGAWTATRTVEEVLRRLEGASVPAGRIYTAADIAADAHYRARGMLDEITMDDGSTLTVPGIVPKLSATPGRHRRNAPALGQDSEQVLRELGLSDAQVAGLRARGIIE